MRVELLFFFVYVFGLLFCIQLQFPSFHPFHVLSYKVTMEFSGGKRKKLKLGGDQRNSCYPHSLQFYLQPPTENISLMEFENLAIDRVKCE